MPEPRVCDACSKDIPTWKPKSATVCSVKCKFERRERRNTEAREKRSTKDKKNGLYLLHSCLTNGFNPFDSDRCKCRKQTRPSVVISHTAPSEGAKEILKDLNGSYFLNKHGDAESRTSRALQEMLEAHQPSAWYFGHFHINREFLIGETTFRCLAEMAISQVSHVFSASERIR